MIELANYDFYKNVYKGQLSSDLFNNLIVKANIEISSNINRKLKESDANNEQVKLVACMLVDLINSNDFSGNSKNIQSYSVDGVSKTFAKLTKAEYNKEKAKILNQLPLEMIQYI